MSIKKERIREKQIAKNKKKRKALSMLITIVLRTAIMFAGLTVAIRILGKRQLGELEISELVTTLMVSELAVSPVTNPDLPLWRGLVPVAVLVTLEVAVSRIMLRSAKFKRFFGGTPAILIKDGKIDARALEKNRIGADELLSALRQAGYSSVDDLAYAVLEANGKLSVIPVSSLAPICPGDLGVEKAERGIAHGVIIDGYVNERSLEQSGRSRKWLEDVLKREGIEARSVLLLTVDDAGTVWYQLRDG